MPQNEALRKKLAAIEHERWADWQEWVHQCGSMDWNVEGEQVLTIPLRHIEQWERQIKTPYADLSDKEKASDMEQVDRYWPLIQQAIELATVEARILSLLDLEQWIKLHSLNREAILEGIEHMCISNMQVPDQPRATHKDRLAELQTRRQALGEGK